MGRITARGENFESQGTAVWIDGANGLVTNLHVVVAARTIEVLPEVGGAPITLRATKIWPSLDLALLEPIGDPNSLPKAGMTAISTCKVPVEAGLEVLSVGYPRGIGYSVSRGIVSGIRVFGELPPAYRQGTPRRAESRWIQTDCPINPGNSGGPLVNAAGELVGINTWGSRVDNDIYFALHVSDVLSALSTPSEVQAEEKAAADASPSINLEKTSYSAYLQVTMPNAREGSSGYLQLRMTPGCQLLVDGALVCQVPAEGATVIVSKLPTEHDFAVEVRKEGFGSGWRMLRIPKTGVLEASVSVGKSLPTELTVASVPVDCLVRIEGPSTGNFEKSEASRTLKDLGPGDYVVRVEKDGRTVEAKLQLRPAVPALVRFNLLTGESNIETAEDPKVVRMWEGEGLGRSSRDIRIGLEHPINASLHPRTSDQTIAVSSIEPLLLTAKSNCGLDRIPLKGLRFRAVFTKRENGNKLLALGDAWEIRDLSIVAGNDACPAIGARLAAALSTGSNGGYFSSQLAPICLVAEFLFANTDPGRSTALRTLDLVGE